MKNTQGNKHRRSGPARIYWPGCQVCQYMKKNQDFRYRIMQSTYFNPQGSENLMGVVHAFGDPFKSSIMYAHMKRHQPKDLVKAAKLFDENGNAEVVNTVRMLETPTRAETAHEMGLDDFIQLGRDKLARGEMSITATTYLTAIKVKMDNEAKTKDRRVDVMKGLFSGAAPKDV